MAADAAYRIVILGGYGQFGRRIVRWLAREPGLQLIVAGRRLKQAEQLVSQPVAREGSSTLAELSALLTLEEFQSEVRDLDIHDVVEA